MLLTSLSEERRAIYNRSLIWSLNELGLNVRAILFISGVVEQDPAELTPSEIAHLIRYIRINAPWALIDRSNLFAGLDHRERRAA